MKEIEKILISGFIITVMFSCLGFNVESENLSTKLVRLHVIANSDTEYDQRIKLTVKDSVSAYTGSLMDSAENMQDAMNIIDENIEEIEKIANQRLGELDTEYKAVASFDTEYYPTREYETFTLPAGDYVSLKVSIGEATGHNWWCVVFPAMCESVAIETDFDDELTETEQKIITKTPQIKFKAYEIFLNILNFFKQK